MEPALGRVVVVTGLVARSLAVKGFVDVIRLARCLLACGRSVIACGLRTAIDCIAFALARTA